MKCDGLLRLRVLRYDGKTVWASFDDSGDLVRKQKRRAPVKNGEKRDR